MKYSVWDYSQVKIAQFNDSHPELAIDPTDIFIFTWFKGFATKTKSRLTKKDGSAVKGMWTKTIDGVDYFNVRYEAIIKDFPILRFSSVKSIQRRFDKYVEAGIFEKKIIHAGKHGNFTYFAFTELFWSFEFDNDNPEHKQSSPDNSVQTKQSGADNSVQTKQSGADNSVQTIIYNPVTSLNNPTATSSASEKTNLCSCQKYPENAEEVFSETIMDLFGYNPCFTPNPYPGLIKNFTACNLPKDCLSEYLTWIFNFLKPRCKNKDNFESYFFKSFTQPVYVAKFAHERDVELKKQADKKARQIECPVCGCVHDKSDYSCPNKECGFPGEMLDSKNEIQKEKAIYQLKKNDSMKYQMYKKELNALLERYPVSKWIVNKEIKLEFDASLSELQSKFLNIKQTA